MATLYVQSLLNSATYHSYVIDLTAPVNNLIVAVQVAQNYNSSDWFDLFAPNGVMLQPGTNLNDIEYGLVDGDRLRVGNKVAHMPKAQRQLAKLQIAELRRKAGGNTSAVYYRARNNFDIDLLPSSPASTTLVPGRPWTV